MLDSQDDCQLGGGSSGVKSWDGGLFSKGWVIKDNANFCGTNETMEERKPLPISNSKFSDGQKFTVGRALV